MTARTGMTNLIRRLRGMTQAGTADYSVAGTNWWTDDQLQEVLDAFRLDVYREPLYVVTEYEGGTAIYHRYLSTWGNFEEATGGSIVWTVEDSNGDEAGTANYTPDYVRGELRFTSDTGGSAYYLTARSYDLNQAAAQVWREKAGWRADFITFRADDQQFNQSDWMMHCMSMAAEYDAVSGLQTATLDRTDLA